MVDWIRVIGSIILVNLVLSGDNALVIGAVAADLPPRTRWLALIAGGGVAIVLRIIFTYFATLLLHLPYLQALGGLVLLIIAARFLLHQRSPHKMVLTRLQDFAEDDVHIVDGDVCFLAAVAMSYERPADEVNEVGLVSSHTPNLCNGERIVG